jgi:uroporphyrinogen-III synthase
MTTKRASVALFRAADDSAGAAARLAERGIGSVIAPVTEFAPVEADLAEGRFDFALATSAKAFAFAGRGALEAAGGLALYVVGDKTAAAARARGFLPQEVAPDVAALTPRLPAGRALYLAGRDRKPDLEAALAGRIATLVVYEARARAGWSEDEARAVAAAAAALHYSARGASLATAFAQSAGIAAAFRRVRHICLARQVAAPLARFGAHRVFWPHDPTEAALFDTLESALAD